MQHLAPLAQMGGLEPSLAASISTARAAVQVNGEGDGTGPAQRREQRVSDNLARTRGQVALAVDSVHHNLDCPHTFA